MATHSSILAWRIPWPEDPGGLHSTSLQKVRQNWVTEYFHFHFTFMCSLRLRLSPQLSSSLSELLPESPLKFCLWYDKLCHTPQNFSGLSFNQSLLHFLVFVIVSVYLYTHFLVRISVLICCHRSERLRKSQHLILTILKAEKLKIKPPDHLPCLVRFCLLVPRQPSFPCVLAWQKENGNTLGIFHKAPTSFLMTLHR